MEIGVVILNYLAYEDTINCVNDFLMQKRKDIKLKIVVVDNNSPNESMNHLLTQFKDNKFVEVVKLDKNFGFANGNNAGFLRLGKNKFDFVVISNDDIRIHDESLFEWIIKEYNEKKFSVLGPDIYSTKMNVHQNPNPNKGLDYKKLKLIHLKMRIKYWLTKFKLYKNTNEQYCVTDDIYKNETENMTLHGAFQIFSKDYFENYDLPYNSQTFLYMEEDLLKLRCLSKNLKMCYSPGFQVEHLQEKATDMIVNNNNRKKFLFRLKHQIKSFKIYLKELKKYLKEKKEKKL